MTLLVDTTVWYAAVDRGDRHHQREAQLLGPDESLVTTDQKGQGVQRRRRPSLGEIDRFDVDTRVNAIPAGHHSAMPTWRVVPGAAMGPPVHVVRARVELGVDRRAGGELQPVGMPAAALGLSQPERLHLG